MIVSSPAILRYQAVEVEFEVTEHFIILGEPRNPVSCAVALTMRDKLGDGIAIGPTGDFTIRNMRDFINQEGRLPLNVCKFIAEFDMTGRGKPFTFTVPLLARNRRRRS